MTKNTKMTEHSRDSMSSPKRCLELVLAAMMIALCLTACSSSDTPVKEEAPSTSNPTETDASESSETEAKDETFALGDTAVFNSIKVTADDLKESDGADTFFKPGDGNVYVGVQFTIENVSDEDQSISTLLLFDAYVDGVKCNYSISANSVFGEGTLDGTVSPGKKLVGYYAVEAPADWAELELQFSSSWLNGSKAAFVFNK